jgi:hypothetical protein
LQARFELRGFLIDIQLMAAPWLLLIVHHSSRLKSIKIAVLFEKVCVVFLTNSTGGGGGVIKNF